jgi:ribosome-associated protein
MRVRHLSDNAEEILSVVVKSMQDGKGKDIVSLNMKKIHTAVTDYFVICHGSSKTQVDAIADKILENVKKECGSSAYNKEGFENSEWILIDYVDVVVHVFLDSTRSFYQLEDLWADAESLTYDDSDGN